MRTRSLKERILHAVCFETLAILTVSPLAAWAMNKPLFQMGSLAIMLSTVAMLWNMIYNSGFDRLYAPGQKRGPGVRVLHALGFEGGFILIGLPIAAWMLDISLGQAFLVEVAFSSSSCPTPWPTTGCGTNCASAGSDVTPAGRKKNGRRKRLPVSSMRGGCFIPHGQIHARIIFG